MGVVGFDFENDFDVVYCLYGLELGGGVCFVFFSCKVYCEVIIVNCVGVNE